MYYFSIACGVQNATLTFPFIISTAVSSQSERVSRKPNGKVGPAHPPKKLHATFWQTTLLAKCLDERSTAASKHW